MLTAAPLGAQSVPSLMRQADSAFAADDRALANRLYHQVVAFDAGQSRAIYRLGVLASNDAEALEWFKRYVTLEAADAWGWVAVGDKSLRLGLPVEARAAFQRAAALAPQAEDVRQRLAKGRLAAAPTVEPQGGYTRDSDGDHTTRAGVSATIALHGGWRFGGHVTTSAIGDGLTTATLDEAALSLAGRPRPAWRFDFSGGPARLVQSDSGSWVTVLGDARMRLRAHSTALELRLNRIALGTTPALVANHAVRNEAKLGFELPAGPLRLRADGRVALINVTGEDANRRVQASAAVVLPVGWRGEFSVQYHETGFQRPSTAGYFAPRRVETVEGGTYWDLGGDGAVSVSADLGAGAQRMALQGAAVGPWKVALRGWAALSIDLTRTLQWRTELEAYSAPFAPVGTSTAPDWRYGSLNTGLQVRLP